MFKDILFSAKGGFGMDFDADSQILVVRQLILSIH